MGETTDIYSTILALCFAICTHVPCTSYPGSYAWMVKEVYGAMERREVPAWYGMHADIILCTFE